MRLLVPLFKGRLGRKPSPGQGSLSFDEEAHPREAKGAHDDKYKAGEFVPRGPRLTVPGLAGKVSQEDAAVDEPIFSKTTGAGQKVEVRIVPSYQGPLLSVRLDGKEVARPYKLTRLPTPKGDVTHYVAGSNNVNVGFRSTETAVIEAALEAAKAAHQETPEHHMEKLRSEREQLALQAAGLHDEARDAFDRAWDRGDEGKAFTEKQRYTKMAEAAATVLAEFDIAHPEVVAAIKAEKAAALKRFQATD